jgi:RHS repeat-associated protein
MPTATHLYNGERVLEELNDSGTMTARYTTENGSYYGSLLHLYRPSGTLSRFPMYDNIGTARGLLDASGTATDWYELDTFGRQVSSSGTTPNPYRYGAAWGYITDPSGMLQLGARFYWPELGRFVSQDPIRHHRNWYLYADNLPVNRIDPTGNEDKCPPCGENGKCKARCQEDLDRAMKSCAKLLAAGMVLCQIEPSPICELAVLAATAICLDDAQGEYDVCIKRCDEDHPCPHSAK